MNIYNTIETIQKKQKELNEVAKQAFKDGCSEIFNKYPKLESFSWPQYEKYFNDGDPCPFQVRVYALEINGVYMEERGEDLESWMDECCEVVSKLLEGIPEDIFHSLFGSHIKVTVTRDNITTQDYSHD